MARAPSSGTRRSASSSRRCSARQPVFQALWNSSTTQRRAYDRRDIPEYNDTRGPACYGLPNHPWMPWPGLDLKNGTDEDSKAGLGNSYFPAGASPGPDFAQQLIEALTGQTVAYQPPPGGTSSGRRAVAAVLSTRSGSSAGSIPTLSALMYAPMVRQGKGEPPL